MEPRIHTKKHEKIPILETSFVFFNTGNPFHVLVCPYVAQLTPVNNFKKIGIVIDLSPLWSLERMSSKGEKQDQG